MRKKSKAGEREGRKEERERVDGEEEGRSGLFSFALRMKRQNKGRYRGIERQRNKQRGRELLKRPEREESIEIGLHALAPERERRSGREKAKEDERCGTWKKEGEREKKNKEGA